MHCHYERSMEARFGVHQQIWAKSFEGSHLSDSWLDDMRPRTAKFVLDEFPVQAIQDFGIDLAKEGLFELPFPSCYFEWQFDGNIQSILVTEDERENGALLGWWAGKQDGGWGASAPFRFRKAKLKSYLNVNDKLGGYAKQADDILGHEGWGKCIETSIEEIVACVALLATKGIEKEAVNPRSVVNKKRVSAGRVPLPSFTIVHLNRYRKKEAKGTHASPCPHFRRGHIRLLPSGKKTPVSPAIVMADPGSMPMYKVPKTPTEIVL